MTIELRVQVRDEPAREYQFDRDRIVLGCHPFNDLVVSDSGMSARHGCLALDHDGLRYEDLGSNVGSCLVRTAGQSELLTNEERPVEAGDMLLLGNDQVVRITILGYASESEADTGPERVCMPPMAADAILDALSPTLQRVLLKSSGRMLRRRDLSAASRALQDIVEATVAGSEASFVVPRGQDAFYDRVVSCCEADTGEAVLASPDPAAVVAGMCADGPCVQITHHPDEHVMRVPFTDDSGDVVLGYLRVQSPVRPTDEQVLALARACAWIQPVLLTVLTLDGLRSEVGQLMAENQYFRQNARRHYLFKELVNESTAMRALYDRIQTLINDDGGVLVAGEAGCGKKMIARALHHLGARRNGIFITANCGISSEQELDRELFGAASRADLPGSGRRGLLELADGGTLFLSEIDRMPMRLQTKLVRVLREREVRREGEETGRTIDVRVVAGTHRNLLSLARAGRFRRDLLGAFGDAILRVPPLRERRDDILPLCAHFIDKYNRRYGLAVEGVAPDTAERLQAHGWQGNVRELQVVVESAVIKTREGRIQPHHLDLAAQPVAADE